MTHYHASGRIRLSLIFCLAALCGPVWAQEPVRIGVVFDGPSEENAPSYTTFEREIRELLEGEFAVVFPLAARVEADWTAAGVDGVLDGVLADPDVDLVITLGLLASNRVAHRRALPKPVFAPFVLNAAVQGIGSTMSGSGTDRSAQPTHSCPSTWSRPSPPRWPRPWCAIISKTWTPDSVRLREKA